MLVLGSDDTDNPVDVVVVVVLDDDNDDDGSVVDRDVAVEDWSVTGTVVEIGVQILL